MKWTKAAITTAAVGVLRSSVTGVTTGTAQIQGRRANSSLSALIESIVVVGPSNERPTHAEFAAARKC